MSQRRRVQGIYLYFCPYEILKLKRIGPGLFGGVTGGGSSNLVGLNKFIYHTGNHYSKKSATPPNRLGPKHYMKGGYVITQEIDIL